MSEYLRWVMKPALRLATGQCEIERIVHTDMHTISTSLSVWRSISKSKRVKRISIDDSFDVHEKYTEIITVKRIYPTVLTRTNLFLSLHSIRYITELNAHIHNLTQTPFVWTNPNHLKLLNELWRHLQPEVRRQQATICEDWKELGFQNKDPSTDFRSMGIFSLYQLEYFARNGTSRARYTLLTSNHPRRYYPFAATGINITALLHQLFRESRFHRILLYAMEKTSMSQSSVDKAVLLQAGVDALHELYMDIYSDFNALWETRDPPDVMSFQRIFSEFKSMLYKKFPKVL